jgi:hypothetical protein
VSVVGSASVIVYPCHVKVENVFTCHVERLGITVETILPLP